MGDDNADLCECVWGHELAMRRLLNVIRNSQSNCADNECFEEGFQRQNPDSQMMMVMLFFVAAMFLYFFRPRPQRIGQDPTKPGTSGNGQGSPPSPPSAMS